MSSHLQSITNELVLRTAPVCRLDFATYDFAFNTEENQGQVLVAFEPGVTVFEYGSFNIADKASGKEKKDAPGSGL